MRILVLLCCLCAASLPSVAQARRSKTTTATALYEQGLKYMRRGYYTKALEQFQRVRNYHRDDPVSVQAQLAIADVYFKKGDYDQARYAYEEFATYHPRHEALDWVVYRMGLAIYKRAPKWAGRDQTSTRGAVNAWTSFAKRFPDSEHLAEVERYYTKGRDRLASKELFIARFYARKGSWGAARNRCEGLLQRYGGSAAEPDALALLGTAYHAWGQTTQALDALARLSSEHADDPATKRLEHALNKAPGEPPVEEIFVRPYRVRGLTDAAAGQH